MPQRVRCRFRILGVFGLVLLLNAISTGQSQTSGIGFPKQGVFDGSAFDSVQINNGNLHIEIPLADIKGRGINITQKFVYDNKGGFRFRRTCFPNLGICDDQVEQDPESNASWRLTPIAPRLITEFPGQDCATWLNRDRSYELIEPDGTRHHFVPDPGFNEFCIGEPIDFLHAQDGTGWRLRLSDLAVFGPDGIRVTPASGVLARDSNGNEMRTTTDTLGRSLPTSAGGVAGVGNFTYRDSAGNPQVVQVTDTPVTIATSLCAWSTADRCFEFGPVQGAMPHEFILPNNVKYTFTYVQNRFAEPQSVVLPTGGQISWTWGFDDAGGRKVASRTVTANGVSGTTTYDFLNQIMTDPDGDQMRWTYVSFPMTPGQSVEKMEYFAGPVSANQRTKTVQTTYSNTFTHAPTIVKTTLHPQNLVTQTETDWEVVDIFPGWNRFIDRRNAIEKREYDFGAGARGGLLRKTTYSYLHQQSGSYVTANIVNRVVSEVIRDTSSPSPIAQTQFVYDSTPLISTSTQPAPNHDYGTYHSGFVTRGNLTEVRRWLKTTNTWLTTVNTYDDLGNLRSTQDPGLHTTTFSYVDDWANAGCGPPVNGQAYVTQATNHLGHRTKTRYFACTGLTQSSRDENDILAARQGTVYSYDLTNRLTRVIKPDNGQTDFVYDDVGTISIQQIDKIDAGQTLTQTKVLDGLGRVSQTQLSDPQGTVFTDTIYDSSGRARKQSNPYRSGETVRFTETVYDALDRVRFVVPPDGTLAPGDSSCTNCTQNSYAGNTITLIDPAGRQRTTYLDALGRITRVDEPGVQQ